MQHHKSGQATTDSEQEWNIPELELDGGFPIEGAGGVMDGGGKATVDEGQGVMPEDLSTAPPKASSKDDGKKTTSGKETTAAAT